MPVRTLVPKTITDSDTTLVEANSARQQFYVRIKSVSADDVEVRITYGEDVVGSNYLSMASNGIDPIGYVFDTTDANLKFVAKTTTGTAVVEMSEG